MRYFFMHYKTPKKQKIVFLGHSWLSLNTHSKSRLAFILWGQPSFYDQWFGRYGFWDNFGDFGSNFGPKKLVLPTFQPDYQVNPENRLNKDYKTAAVLEFSIIVKSPPFLD